VDKTCFFISATILRLNVQNSNLELMHYLRK
jgi:hypothetical protein